MNLQEATAQLADTTFLLGRFRQNAALKFLAETEDIAAIAILVKALEGGHHSGKISTILLAEQRQDQVDELWRLWAQSRSSGLGSILRKKDLDARDPELQRLSLLKLNRPAEIGQDRASVRRTLALLGDPDPEVQQAVAAYGGLLQADDDNGDEIYAAWLKHDSAPLAEQIRRCNHKPTNPAMEALFLLLHQQVEPYLALENEQGERFQEAYTLADEAMRQRLNEVVLLSGNPRLTQAYERALSGGSGFDLDLFLRALKTANNESGLLEASRHMTLPGLLDLCQRWSENGWRPEDPRTAALVERALAGFAQVGDLELRVEANTPPGTVDLFEYWRRQNPGDEELRAGLDQEDPFLRARSLYLGSLRGTLPEERMAQAARSDDWPERLVARLFRPELAEGPDHVHWVNVCGGSADLLTMPVACTPDQHSHVNRLIEQSRPGKGEDARRYQGLLTILHAFQACFADWIEVSEDDSSDEQGAAVFSDLEEAPL